MTLPSAPPAHTGAFGRLPHCWHSNDKVNIEPKILGVAGCGVAGRAQRGNSYLGPAWLYQGLKWGWEVGTRPGAVRVHAGEPLAAADILPLGAGPS